MKSPPLRLPPAPVETKAAPLDTRHLLIQISDEEKTVNLQGSVPLSHAADVEVLLGSGKTAFRTRSSWMRSGSYLLYRTVLAALEAGALDGAAERHNKLLSYLRREGERLDYKAITGAAERAITNLWDSYDRDGAAACLKRVLEETKADNPHFGQRVAEWAANNPRLSEVRAYARSKDRKK